MLIDQNLSNFSDIAVQTAFVIYAIALFISLVYYGRMQGVIEAGADRVGQRRWRSEDLSANSSLFIYLYF